MREALGPGPQLHRHGAHPSRLAAGGFGCRRPGPDPGEHPTRYCSGSRSGQGAVFRRRRRLWFARPPTALRAAANITPTTIRLARETRGGNGLLSSHHYLLALFEDPSSMAAKTLRELRIGAAGGDRPHGHRPNHRRPAHPSLLTSSPRVRPRSRDHAAHRRPRSGPATPRQARDGWDELGVRLQEFSREVLSRAAYRQRIPTRTPTPTPNWHLAAPKPPRAGTLPAGLRTPPTQWARPDCDHLSASGRMAMSPAFVFGI